MNSLSLYLHFPFCREKCRYCDFYSLTDLSRSRAYEKALCRHLEKMSFEAKDYEIVSVYLGGGTPSLITPGGVGEIFSTLRGSFSVSPTAEITAEMNPESATEKGLFAFRAAGVNRVSFGMQSGDDGELARLGRIHRYQDVKNAVKAAKKAGFENISLDLMYGLPGQNTKSFAGSLEKALSLGIRHLSFYLLTLSPTVPLYREKENLPDEETVREMYLYASDHLTRNGFEHYEISNAALPGYRSRHNEVYWTGGEYLGFGAGAHSCFRGERFFIKEGVAEYLSAADPWERVSSREKLTPADRRTEYVMLSLRRKEGISLSRLLTLADQAFCDKTERKMSLWASHGLCFRTAEGFALTPRGFLVSNEIISEFI